MSNIDPSPGATSRSRPPSTRIASLSRVAFSQAARRARHATVRLADLIREKVMIPSGFVSPLLSKPGDRGKPFAMHNALARLCAALRLWHVTSRVPHRRSFMGLKEINARVRTAAEEAGRAAESVELIAVSKVQPDMRVEAVLREGHRVFGENRVQEAAGKWPGFRERFEGIA